MHIITRVRFCNENIFFSVGPAELLEKIDQYSSIQGAIDDIGMSYAKALRILRTIEAETGYPAVHSLKGGSKGGQTKLTEKGRKLLDDYYEIYDNVSKYADTLFKAKFGE